MKLFECQHCRNLVHFDSTVCVNCGYLLGYHPWRFTMRAIEPGRNDSEDAEFCANRLYDACNWLAFGDGERLCVACRHNRTVPDLSVPRNLANWRRLETAKRYLFYSLTRWRLPLADRREDPAEGLAFDFLTDHAGPVTTGHERGLITINVGEADDAERERMRAAMGEPYRTLVGHFRHEIGHYYWDRLVRDGGALDGFRALFGDERADYAAALGRHYESGPPANWQDAHISTYAAAHPWEDFAETFAHYIHMVDAVETAQAFGIRIAPRTGQPLQPGAEPDFQPYEASAAADVVEAFVPLTVAINSVNRSMGQPDLYPFVLSAPVVEKLDFVHALVHRRG